jgi:hypothetical protein
VGVVKGVAFGHRHSRGMGCGALKAWDRMWGAGAWDAMQA